MKISFLFGLLALCSMSFAADDDFFPIMAWNHAPADAAVLKKMHECGLTVAGFVAPKDLDLVHAAGMKAIVNDSRVAGYQWDSDFDAADARRKVESLIAEVNNHPAVFGYYLRDEPPASYFAGLEKVASVIREKAPGKWPYFNLFPNYAEDWQLNSKGYVEYLDKFIATCKPPILSYDHYALMDDGSLRGGYFQNLEQMRGAAVKAKIPFWNIVLSNATFNFREPTHADIRFQAYTTLAYGGRGLSYFTYFAPQVGNYRAAPIDQFGHETPTWRFLQNVNLQVLKLAATINKLTSDDVYHFGTLPAGCHAPGEKSVIKELDPHMMVGDFTHADGSRWVMIVNKDPVKSFPCAPVYRTAAKKVQLLSPYSGQLTAFEGEQVWLAAGQGAVLKVQF
jgi:hypothetical protein